MPARINSPDEQLRAMLGFETTLLGRRRRMETKTILNILGLILAGSPLSEVLTIIARLVESRGDGTLCTIWLPNEDGTHLLCAAAPSLPGFITQVGAMLIGPKGGSCGTAAYRKEPVFVTDIRTDPVWDHYRHLLLPYGIRAVWSRPLFTSDGKVLGTFAIHYREARTPNAGDLELIENFSHIAGIAIERHLNEEKLRHERDRLRLLLDITSSVTSRLDLRQVVEGLSTNLFRTMQCDVSALLLPDTESGELRVSILHNPDARGPYREGSLVPMNGSISGQVLRKGKSIRIDSFEQVREDPETLGNPEGQVIYQRLMQEGLTVGCYLPLKGRDCVVGVLMLCRRANSPFDKDDVILLEQVACQIAIAVENTLEYEKATKDRDKEAKQRVYLEEEIRAEFGAIVGESPALKTALHLVSIVAPTDSSVLILGETGSGNLLTRDTRSSSRAATRTRYICAYSYSIRLAARQLPSMPFTAPKNKKPTTRDCAQKSAPEAGRMNSLNRLQRASQSNRASGH
jgi:formate hydrogenlyase transcriptional activator